MKTFLKVLKATGYAVLMLLSAAISVFGFYCLHLVVEGQFTWQIPYAPVKAFAAMGAILFIAYAGSGIFEDHPREYGLTQIFIGCLILMTQFGQSATQHVDFAIHYFAGLYFLIQGIQNLKRKKPVRS